MVCANFIYGAEAPMAKVLWLFYISKILDFMDTVRSHSHSRCTVQYSTVKVQHGLRVYSIV